MIEVGGSAPDRIRTLIIGAGIGGLTLAALMKQRGEQPLVIEREQKVNDRGYMLGLYPMGSNVLHGLRLHEAFMSESVSMTQYHIGNGKGEIIREYSLEEVAKKYGPIQGISRGKLVDLLLEAAGDLPIHYGTTATQINQLDDEVEVTLSDGTTARFDLVVAADGLHSQTRSMILDEGEFEYWNTGWGGWVFWSDSAGVAEDTYVEYWGAGRFLGIYPVKDRLGIFIGGPTSTTDALGMEGFIDEVFKHFKHPVLSRQSLVSQAGKPFYWNFHDCRSSAWHKGRVALLGDAAVGFIPTAGVGATMAMESAAVLNDVLSRTDAAHIEQVLSLYEKRRRQRVEAAQDSSRQMGKLMFIESWPLAWGRDRLLGFYTVEQLVKGIAKIADEPI